MSIFKVVQIACPSCGTPVNFNAVFSLNADRRPDLRDAILDGSFQREVCAKCQSDFRLDPELTYIDVARGQWIAAFPFTKLDQWRQLEAQTRDTYNRAYGPKASAAAREIGATMKPRLTFGWAALREKLVAVEAGLDDVILELTKTAIVRGIDNPPLGAGTELRLGDVDGDQMAVAWLEGATEKVKEFFNVPRSLYDEILADPGSWQTLQSELTSGMFVDMNRLLLAAA